MAYGLYVATASGKVIVSPSFRMGRFLGVYLATGAGSIVVPDLAQGTPWVSVHDVDGLKEAYITPTISGTTISWTHTSRFGQTASSLIYYGVY